MTEEAQVVKEKSEVSSEETKSYSPEEIKGINQRIIRDALQEVATISPSLYKEIQSDHRFPLLSRRQHDHPQRTEAMIWFLGQLKRVGTYTATPASETLQQIQEKLSNQLANEKPKQPLLPTIRKGLTGQG